MAGRKILIVDDEPEFVEITTALMESNGYQVVAARDGEEGMKKALEERPDLIILDVQMPKRDGFAGLYALRQDPRRKPIPVILLTGLAKRDGIRFSAERVKAYMGEEPEAFLDKPVNPEQLLEAIRRAIG